jgi:hypothetical protein
MRLNKRQLWPIAYECLERVGDRTDGAYVVDGRLIDKAIAILSLGLGYEWTFDETVRRRNPGAVIIGVDPTIRPSWFVWTWLKTSLKLIIYRPLGDAHKIEWNQRWNTISRQYFRLFRGPIQHIQKFVSDKDGPGEVSIPTLIRMLGEIPRHGLVLKMDIEGSEYGVIPDICENHGLISTLAVEFHDVTTQPERFNRSVELLREHFSIVHIHGNNVGPYSSEENFPDVLEITFIHKDLCPTPERPSGRTYPDPVLDVPNKPGRADYPLKFGDAAG